MLVDEDSSVFATAQAAVIRRGSRAFRLRNTVWE